MKKWQRRAALAFFVIAAGAAAKAVDIGFGSFDAPGPGFFPFALLIVLPPLFSLARRVRTKSASG